MGDERYQAMGNPVPVDLTMTIRVGGRWWRRVRRILMAKPRKTWKRLVCVFRDHQWTVSAVATGMDNGETSSIVHANADIRCERCEATGSANDAKDAAIRLEFPSGMVLTRERGGSP